MSGPGTEASAGSESFGSAILKGGTGLGVIGTANRGPAFKPISILDLNNFIKVFGDVSSTHFGTLAAKAWLDNTSSCTYLKLLGVGDGEPRAVGDSTNSDGENISAGAVKNAGFVVGSKMTGSAGTLVSNEFAVNGGLPGRTYFLGSFMSESNGSSYFSDAGIQNSTNGCVPILRGVLFAASGVLPALSGCYTGNASTSSVGATVGSFSDKQDGGATVGSINLTAASQKFVMLLNGHKNTAEYPNTITASLNFLAADTADGSSLYFADVFNTDPTKIQQAGHYLHSYYTVEASQAEVTGSGIVADDKFKIDSFGDRLEESIFLVTSSLGRNPTDGDGLLKVPNFENFCDRYQTALTPMVISQKFNGGGDHDLFRFHSLHDGSFGGSTIKITIENLVPPQKDGEYGSFDVVIRSLDNFDVSKTPVSGSEKFNKVNLDPSSDHYIAKVIGDNHFYYNWDGKKNHRRFVNSGQNPNFSRFVRVEVAKRVDDKNLPTNILPMGFRGFSHLLTSGSSILSNPQHPLDTGAVIAKTTEWGNRIVEPPIPYRTQIGDQIVTTGVSSGERALTSELCWGVQTTRVNTAVSPNTLGMQNQSIKAYQKWFPNFSTSRQQAWVGASFIGTADSEGTVYDPDRFNNNKFSLENILIHALPDTDTVDNTQWAYAQYRRDGTKTSLIHGSDFARRTENVRFFDPKKDLSKSLLNEFTKFTFLLQGGYDGFDIFSNEKKKFSNLSAYYENQNANQGGKSGATTAAYLKALKILEEKAESNIKIMAIPGIRIEQITNQALSVAEDRFDAFYVMDIEEVASGSALVVTSSGEVPSPSLTAERFRNRVLNSSFAAVYFPDVQMTDPKTFDLIFTPPSISALRVYSRLDSQGSVSAPAGQIRGKIENATGDGTAIQTKVVFDNEEKSTLKALYDVAINPIIASDGGLILFGQRTLLSKEDSMLQRVSVRRMILEIRRLVKEVAKGFLFSQNKEEVLKSFESSVKPILVTMLNAGGISKYDVVIDTTTTTQADIESNVVRGKVLLQPSKSDEIIQVDFST